MELDDVKATFIRVQEKFREVKKLLCANDQKLNTESERYKNKYDAIKIFKEMDKDLNNIVNIGAQEERNEIAILAFVHMNLGILHTETDETKVGEDHFMKCVELLKGRELHANAVISLVKSLNQLGIIWTQWNQPSKGKIFLDRSEQIYKNFVNVKHEPIHVESYFDIEDTTETSKSRAILDELHILTLYYLAQIYETTNEFYKSALYCHMTLRLQLIHSESLKNLDYIDWALNAATLSQFFMESKAFSQARNHLSAASFMLQKHESMMANKHNEKNEEERAADQENYKHRSADVARCWAKYGLLLLSSSTQRLLEQNENDDDDACKKLKDSDANSEKDTEHCLDNLQFEFLEKDIEPFVNEVTDKYLLDFNDARKVFINAQKWLEKAKEYYTLDDRASDYVQIVQDMSQAYKHLIFFEENDDRQAKMHKRRIDILENVTKELNPEYYKAECRQMWLELGEIYSDILDIKLDRLHQTDRKPTAHALTKINHLAKNAINYFQTYLDSFETNSTVMGVSKYSDDTMQLALRSYFHLGRLYNKIITPDKSVQLENAQNSINAYTYIMEYCKNDPKAAEVMKIELGLCTELVTLLSVKIKHLQQELRN